MHTFLFVCSFVPFQNAYLFVTPCSICARVLFARARATTELTSLDMILLLAHFKQQNLFLFENAASSQLYRFPSISADLTSILFRMYHSAMYTKVSAHRV